MATATKAKPRAKREKTDATECPVARRPANNAGDHHVDTEAPRAGNLHGGDGGLNIVNDAEYAIDHHEQGGSVGERRIEADRLHADTCRQIQELQRRRVATLKARIAIDNQLAALVSQELGYSAGMDEADRKQRRADASKLIGLIDKGKPIPSEWQDTAARVGPFVETVLMARDPFEARLNGFEKEMAMLAKSLPVAEWVQSVRGFGIMNFAVIIGECGDLSNYANPAKVWKRLGLAPFNGKMPSTWRFGKEGKLTAEEWTAIGYSPRRRSAMYVLSECIVKLNQDGDYRKRYDEAKAACALKHPDYPKGRCHYHGMLLAVKRLVLDLWLRWNGRVLC